MAGTDMGAQESLMEGQNLRAAISVRQKEGDGNPSYLLVVGSLGGVDRSAPQNSEPNSSLD